MITNRPRRASRCVVALIAVVAAGAAQAGEGDNADPQVERTGDTLQVAVPLVALALTFFIDDSADPAAGSGLADNGLDVSWGSMNGSPRHDLALAFIRTEVATYGFKYSVAEQRPNGGSESFPSGHTSVAFAGAEFIRKQYGWSLGAPAYLAAGYVGWSRVVTGNHWTHDVLAGAAIGILSNHDSLDFAVPIGRGAYGELTLAPAMLTDLPALGFDPPDSAGEARDMQPPAPGLRLEFRF